MLNMETFKFCGYVVIFHHFHIFLCAICLILRCNLDVKEQKVHAEAITECLFNAHHVPMYLLDPLKSGKHANILLHLYKCDSNIPQSTIL